MDYLASNDFQVWPLSQLIESLRNGNPLPDKVIAITFDDGYKSVYSNALPVMKKHGFPFTVFINTDLVGGRQKTGTGSQFSLILETIVL